MAEDRQALLSSSHIPYPAALAGARGMGTVFCSHLASSDIVEMSTAVMAGGSAQPQ